MKVTSTDILCESAVTQDIGERFIMCSIDEFYTKRENLKNLIGSLTHKIQSLRVTRTIEFGLQSLPLSENVREILIQQVAGALSLARDDLTTLEAQITWNKTK